jgi:hypothetical protein
LTCATDGGVVGLQLQGNNLNGTVDAALAAAALAPLAPSLEYIFLRGNLIREKRLVFSFPFCLAHCLV